MPAMLWEVVTVFVRVSLCDSLAVCIVQKLKIYSTKVDVTYHNEPYKWSVPVQA